MKKTKVLASIFLGLILSVCFAFGIGGIKKDAKKVSAWTQSDIKYFGYDLSVHQGVVDFNVMKNYADFVICRIGYSTSLDTRFLTYMRDAKAAGLHIGIYIFSLAENTTQAQNEADWVVSTLAANGFDKGYLDFPVFFDYEVSSVIQSKTKAENSAIVNAFVDRMANAGYYAAMYVGGSNYKSYFDHSTLKCSAWVAHYGYSDQVSYFEARYSGYNTCMWQFDGDGYDTASTKRGTAVGASSTNIDHNWCFVDFPTIIKDGGYNGHSAKINKEVADSGNWVTTNNYDRCNENFDSRSITLSSAKTDENPIDFINDNSSEILATATFKLNGKVSSELAGKIGISLINDDKGMFFYADAKGTTGTALSNITGNSFGVVYRANNAWNWATDTAITGVTYDINKEFTLKVVKENKAVKLYVNDLLLKTLSTTDFGVTANATCQVQIRSFQINATVTKYLCTPTMASVIKIDGDFTDWANLPNYNSVVASKKTIFDKTDSLKGAEFFVANTKYGLFVYAKATHDKDFKGNASWFNNTYVEMFLVDSNNQYWANHQQFSGFSSAYFNTKKVGDRYQTNFEGFISSSSIPSYKIDLKYGLAFKVDNGTSKDTITPTGSTTATSYWCAENSDPKNVAHIISNKVAVSYNTSTSVKFKDSANFTKLGNTISIKTTNTTTNTDVLHLTSNNTVNQAVSATFSITGKYKNEGYAKLGLSFIDEYGDGFFFYADAAGGSGSSLVSSITGTTFGLVYCNDGVFYWEDSKSIALSGANFSASSPFTMKIERANTVAKLYVGNTLMHTISDTTKYYIQSGQVVYPSITTFNTYFDVTNVSVTPIDNSNDLTIDGNLSDWKALSNWDKINASKATITDSLATGKQATFYTRLVDSGLYVYMLANHNVNVTNYLESEWWKNTNFEMFINGTDSNSQLYATALFDKGFTNCVFTTTESSGKFVTNFEGFIDIDTLVGVYGYTTNYLNVGMAFKVDNLGGTADSITPQGGTATSYWCANNIDPRDIGIKVEKLVEEITPPTPPTPPTSSSSSSSSVSTSSKSSSSSSVEPSSSSKPSSSSNPSSSSKPSSSVSSVVASKSTQSSSSKNTSSNSSSSQTSLEQSSSQTISSTQNESSSTVGTAKKKGCGGSINATALISILAIFAIIIFTKRQSKRM